MALDVIRESTKAGRVLQQQTERKIAAVAQQASRCPGFVIVIEMQASLGRESSYRWRVATRLAPAFGSLLDLGELLSRDTICAFNMTQPLASLPTGKAAGSAPI